MNEKYYVLIIKYDTEQAVKTMGPMSERKADKVDSGANISLNHEYYYTVIETEEEYNERCQVESMLA